MAITPLRAFLFATGGLAAVAAVAYVAGAFDPYINKPSSADVSALSQSSESAPMSTTAGGTQGRMPEAGEAGSNPPAASSATDAMKPMKSAEEGASSVNSSSGNSPSGNPAPANPAPAGVIAPSFDVMRVEGNGSVVVAGKAAPAAKIEIVHGSTVLGETVAGPDGDFVFVLNNPLKPGDYQIVLRSTAPGNVVATSTQTAVLSIPEKPDGQVLAMVEEPGKPAELLTLPKSEAKPEAAAESGSASIPAQDGQPSAATAPTPDEQAAPQTDEAQGQGDDQSAPVATVPPAATAPAAETVPSSAPKIVVEAVEIDGSKIFVAGQADPGSKVRAYANEILLGDALTSPDGHFLVEATRDIPVGEYTIRVDGLDAGGSKVVARATVPFQREPGESVAAVAPSQSMQSETKTAAGETPVASAEPSASTPASSVEPAATGSQESEKVASASPSDEVAATVSPKLEHADSAVIIRRGDTLWRISRRVYGRGIRYSTIYLANQNQISDPDRIWPGQVFKLPEQSKDGEAADLDAMGDQITTTPQ